MVRKIKKKIQQKLNNICYKKYLKERIRQEDAYRQWYLRNENWKRAKYPEPDPEIVLFADRRGVVEEQAAGLVTAFFREHPWVRIAYGDEDCVDREGRRYAPWFKPDWSPDTLESFSYFGHFFAVHRSLLEELDPDVWQPCLDDCDAEACHRLLLALTKKVTDTAWIPANGEKKAIASIDKVLIHMKRERLDETEEAIEDQGPAEGARMPAAPCGAVVSAVIPSKDNPGVLEVCISGLREKTALSVPVPGGDAGGVWSGADSEDLRLEIIVVDNGSSPENRAIIEEMARRYDFQYLYEPMPFNFSRMCNLGAERAAGSFLLLLNDDMEIIEPLWLLRLLERARLPHAGAVGAKLLYPDSDLIQHVGITNLKVGPAHKLLKMHDEKSYYHGQNRHMYDMIGVTAACLLVEMRKYEEAGGLYEGMAVAYNDVDLCFALYELGYYNILRNDVVLFHHESLSRGDDNLSDEKWVRLLQEKEILYERHPSLRGYDPFYSRNLAGISNIYNADFMYEFEMGNCYVKVKPWKNPEPLQWKNECLIVNLEHGRLERKLELTDRDEVYWIEGWSYVLGMDNCRYRRSILLQGEKGGIYEAEVMSRYRKDVTAVLPGQVNVDLAGFVCRIPAGALPADTYTISMLAKDQCSNQKLYRKTDRSFTLREKV
ncbi:MAG: glycosyltransferase [Lachnospiraceae bacterium]|jgi:GT2 family glycosyltransferase|nr:glycosyltransferase [Lachnospiraceae bacterium]